MRDVSAYGVLIWCILIFVVGIVGSWYIANRYLDFYMKEKEKAKRNDLDNYNVDPNNLTEEQKLAKKACPFAHLLDEPNHNLSKEFKDLTKQEQCPVTGYVTPLPMLLDTPSNKTTPVPPVPPVPPPHPKFRKKEKKA